MDNNDILKGFGELVTEREKAWIRSKLKLETIIQLKLRLESEN